METKACPACGARYVATTTMCADCGVDLVEDAPPAGGEQLGAGDQVAYDLEAWDPDDRVLVDRLLTSENVPHAWEVATLVVRREDEDRVDRLLDSFDTGDEDVDLDPDRPQLEYELEGWSDDQRQELDAVLDEHGVAHAWDDETSVLVVYEDDEERVEALLDAVEFPDALDEAAAGDDQGTEAQDVMSALFVAADRLLHDPGDADGVLEAVAAADRAAALPTPFGFTEEDWATVLEQTGDLKQALEGDADDETVVERATTLRTTLRGYV